MLESKLQEALGDLDLTYGLENAGKLWVETCGFRTDVVETMAKYPKSGIVSIDKLLESMELLRDIPDSRGDFKDPLELIYDRNEYLSIFEDTLASLIEKHGVEAVRRMLRKHAAEQRWEDFMNQYDYTYIKAMQSRHSQDIGEA